MTFIGTVEDDIIMDQVDSPEIVDDLELGQDEAVDIKDKEVNKQKLRKRIDQFKERNCLFWILTTRCLITDPQQRIYLNSCGHDLHEFLTAVYDNDMVCNQTGNNLDGWLPW